MLNSLPPIDKKCDTSTGLFYAGCGTNQYVCSPSGYTNAVDACSNPTCQNCNGASEECPPGVYPLCSQLDGTPDTSTPSTSTSSKEYCNSIYVFIGISVLIGGIIMYVSPVSMIPTGIMLALLTVISVYSVNECNKDPVKTHCPVPEFCPPCPGCPDCPVCPPPTTCPEPTVCPDPVICPDINEFNVQSTIDSDICAILGPSGDQYNLGWGSGCDAWR